MVGYNPNCLVSLNPGHFALDPQPQALHPQSPPWFPWVVPTAWTGLPPALSAVGLVTWPQVSLSHCLYQTVNPLRPGSESGSFLYPFQHPPWVTVLHLK